MHSKACHIMLSYSYNNTPFTIGNSAAEASHAGIIKCFKTPT